MVDIISEVNNSVVETTSRLLVFFPHSLITGFLAGDTNGQLKDDVYPTLQLSVAISLNSVQWDLEWTCDMAAYGKLP